MRLNGSGPIIGAIPSMEDRQKMKRTSLVARRGRFVSPDSKWDALNGGPVEIPDPQPVDFRRIQSLFNAAAAPGSTRLHRVVDYDGGRFRWGIGLDRPWNKPRRGGGRGAFPALMRRRWSRRGQSRVAQ